MPNQLSLETLSNDLQRLLTDRLSERGELDLFLSSLLRNPALLKQVIALTNKTLEGEYDPNVFVDPGIADEIVERLLREPPKGDDYYTYRPTTHIIGSKGSGKTTLMRHLHHKEMPKHGVTSLLINVGGLNDNGEHTYNLPLLDQHNDLKKQLIRLMRWIGETLEIHISQTSYESKDAELENLQLQVEAGVAELFEESDKNLVLFIDDIDSQPEEFLLLMEKYLLYPILNNSQQVRVVMYGKKRHRWISPRLSSFSHEEPMRPFNLHSLSTLLERHNFDVDEARLGEIYRISGGYPGPALTLARSEDLRQGVRDALTETLDSVTPDKAQQGVVLGNLEALALLNRWEPDSAAQEWGIKDSDMLKMLNAYEFFRDQGWSAEQTATEQDLEQRYLEFREKASNYFGKPEMWQRRNKLQNHQLIRWNSKTVKRSGQNEKEARGYFVDELARYLVAHNLRLNKPGLWQWLHYVAYRMFSRRAEKYDDKLEKPRYAPLAKAHEDAWKEATDYSD